MTEGIAGSGVLVVGLGHKAQHGKDTVADIFVQYGFRKYQFADRLKMAASVIFSWAREDLENPEFKATVDPFWGFAPREALQRLGTEGGRDLFGQDIWIKAAERAILQDGVTKVIFPDTRFLNEANAVKDWGGLLYKVYRPDFIPEGFTTEQLAHASEMELDDYDGWNQTIINDGTIEELVVRADCLAGELARNR